MLNLLTLAEMTFACIALPVVALNKNTSTVLEGQEAKMSVYQLMFWNSIFLKKAKLNVFLTFFHPKITTLPPSIIAPSIQLLVNQILSKKQLIYIVAQNIVVNIHF